MRYLSICSGIEAATQAWHGLGWQPLAFSEIEPFPSAVLAHHHPHVPNLGDFTRFADWPSDLLHDTEVLVGGTPCQAFSIAGLRKSLDDARGNLTPTECERLQGFPDLHTQIPWRGKPATVCPDGPRYKALGNSMAVPVMRWLGQRLHTHLTQV